jgi:hypothetical protein
VRRDVAEEYAEALEAKAEFCLITGVAPSEYDQLTDDEREAFIDKANELAEKRDNA